MKADNSVKIKSNYRTKKFAPALSSAQTNSKISLEAGVEKKLTEVNTYPEEGLKEEDLLTKKAQGAMLFTLMPILSLFAIILLGLIKDASIMEIAKIGTLTLVLTAASVFFIRLQEENILRKKYAKSIIIVGYLISILLIMLPIRPEIYSFWMIGGLMISMLVDVKLGLLIYFNLTFILSVTITLAPETTIHFLIIGVLMSLLAGAIRNKTTVIYAAVILLSTNVTLAFVINNFIFDANSNYNYLSSFFSILAVLITAFLVSAIYDKLTVGSTEVEGAENSSVQISQKVNSTAVEQNARNTSEITTEERTSPGTEERAEELSEAEEQSLLTYRRGIRTSCELLVNPENNLLQRLKNQNEAVYEHSLRIGDISGRAAEQIGAEVMLARAGGYYHEIGKLNGKDYILEGLMIAEEHSFPRELTTIIRQHNIKHEKPTSVEAAIVMLTDTVVATIEYIRKTDDKKYTVDKIVDNIFQMRMDKGTFDDSGISVKDYKTLKEFYLKEFQGSLS